MPWVRLDDGYFTNGKVAELSKDAKLLDLAAIAFSARELRDGILSRTDIRVIAAHVDVEKPFDAVHELIEAGRWEMDGQATYIIHDYLVYNPSREQVLAERESARQRMQEVRAKRKRRSPELRPNFARSSSNPDPDPEPGPVNESDPVPYPIPRSEPDDARATRGSSESKIGRADHRNGHVARASPGLRGACVEAPAAIARFNADLSSRIQTISSELEDNNTSASITRAQRLQAAAHLDDGHMANAIKDARRRTRQRMEDHTLKRLGSPMAYFMGVLEKTTQERAQVSV